MPLDKKAQLEVEPVKRLPSLVSHAAVSEITERLWEEYAAFTRRDLVRRRTLGRSALFHNMRACALGDPILVAGIIRAIEERFPTLGQAPLLQAYMGGDGLNACGPIHFDQSNITDR